MSGKKRSDEPGAPWAKAPPDHQRLRDASLGFLTELRSPESEEVLGAAARRMAEAWSEDLLVGYRQDPDTVVTAFPAGEDRTLVVVRDVEFTSFCVHHLLPFFGRAHLAYLPSERLTGISKLARLVDVLSRRLQIQERMTRQILDGMDAALEPRGSAVVVEAEHLCMTARGVRHRDSRVMTTAWSGCFEQPDQQHALLEMLRDPVSSQD
jgi:GTP cyclohydrolase I